MKKYNWMCYFLLINAVSAAHRLQHKRSQGSAMLFAAECTTRFWWCHLAIHNDSFGRPILLLQRSCLLEYLFSQELAEELLLLLWKFLHTDTQRILQTTWWCHCELLLGPFLANIYIRQFDEQLREFEGGTLFEIRRRHSANDWTTKDIGVTHLCQKIASKSHIHSRKKLDPQFLFLICEAPNCRIWLKFSWYRKTDTIVILNFHEGVPMQ